MVGLRRKNAFLLVTSLPYLLWISCSFLSQPVLGFSLTRSAAAFAPLHHPRMSTAVTMRIEPLQSHGASSGTSSRSTSRLRRVKQVSSPPWSVKVLNGSVDDHYHDEEKGGEQERRRQMKRRRRKLSVFAILASGFLNLLGFTMAGPITPALGKHFGLEVGASFGSLTSAYPFGMLFGLVVWPTLSDRIGRPKIMTLSLLGSGLGLTLQSMVIRRQYSLPCFLLARALTGAFAGSAPISKAYLADIGYKEGKLPRYLALRDASSTMAFIVGPLLGGILYDLKRRFFSSASSVVSDGSGSLAFVIGISAAASLGAALLVGVLVKDGVPSRKQTSGKTATMTTTTGSDDDSSLEDSPQDTAEELISCPLGARLWAGVASVCLVSFLFNIGDSTFHAFFSALLRDGAGMTAGDIGILYTLLACVSFTVSTTTASRMLSAAGPVLTCAAGLACIGSGLSALGLAAWNQVVWFPPTAAVLTGSAALYYCGVPLYGPTIPTMLLQCVPSHQRGAIMGLDGMINTIGRILSPLVMGDIYRRYGAGAAFGLAGSMVFGGALTTLVRRWIVLRDAYASPSTTATP